MAVLPPPPLSTNPIRRVVGELAAERRAPGGLPPGDTAPSVSRTRRMIRDPLGLLLDAYERHGPVFSLRVLHANNVFMLGPEANHFMLVSGAEHFRWRDGGFGDLIPLLGDGLLTIDGDFHRRSRRIMLPAFHHERIAGYAGVMEEEAARGLESWRDGERVDVYRWTPPGRAARGHAGAVRARPGRQAGRPRARAGVRARARLLRRGLLAAGPARPAHAVRAADARPASASTRSSTARSPAGAGPAQRGQDVLSLLLDAPDRRRMRAPALSDRHVRDEVMTLLFAGHDTTTSTISFLLWELARGPDWEDLEPAIEETLRLYPPAWIGPRRSTRAFALHGHHVPAGVPVNYSSWA